MCLGVVAKESVFRDNKNLVESKIWLSTLDSRTTPLICGVRDGLEYTLDNEPVGHGYNWDAGPGRIHWNCRSTSIPKLKGVPYTAPRPAIEAGKNYKRGDRFTNRGTVRKLSKSARDKGIYSSQIKTTRSKYEGWLRTQSKENIDYVSDILGSKKKAQLFRDGASLADLGALSPVTNPLSSAAI